MHPNAALDWYTGDVQLISQLIGALSAFLIIRKYMRFALLLFFINDTVLLAHFFNIHKVNIFAFLITYWEFVVLSLMLCRMRKTPGTISGPSGG